MHNTSATSRYQNDPVFRRIVDMLRVSLLDHHFTSTELREAAILAASMHDSQTIKPLVITKTTDRPWKTMEWVYMDEAPKFITYGTSTGRIQSSKPNVSSTPKEAAKTPSRRSVRGDRRNHSHDGSDNTRRNSQGMRMWDRIQTKYVALGREVKTGDRRKTPKVEPKATAPQRRVRAERRIPGSINTRLTWSINYHKYVPNWDRIEQRRKTVPNHFHVFNYDGTHKDFKVCSCGVSDVYYYSLGQKP